MDLKEEISNHLEWIEKIAALLGEQEVTDAALEDVRSHNNCELGRWLRSGESEGYRSYPEFHELTESHNTFHELAAEMIAALQKDDEARALESEQHFIEMSQKVVACLQILEKKGPAQEEQERAD